MALGLQAQQSVQMLHVRSSEFSAGAHMEAKADSGGVIRFVIDERGTTPFVQSCVHQTTAMAQLSPDPSRPFFTVRQALPIPAAYTPTEQGRMVGLDEGPRVACHRREIVGVHQQQGSGGQQTDNDGAQGRKDALHHGRVHIAHEHFADENHQNQRGQNEGEGGYGRAENGHKSVIISLLRSSVATVGRRIDADGTGCHLRNRHDVRKLCRREPLVVYDGLGLDEREHSVAAAETEKADLEKCYK